MATYDRNRRGFGSRHRQGAVDLSMDTESQARVPARLMAQAIVCNIKCLFCIYQHDGNELYNNYTSCVIQNGFTNPSKKTKQGHAYTCYIHHYAHDKVW